MKKKVFALLLCVCTVASLLCGCGKGYDYEGNDLSGYITLPSDALTRDYAADVTLKAAPTDADVEKDIETTVKDFGTEAEITDGAVEDGDTLVMDYTGKIDGEAFDGGSATDTEHEVLLDESTFIAGFDAGLIGMKVNETKDLNLTFPDPYENNPDLSGKPVVFTVTVKKITRTAIPVLTEELMAEHADTFGEDTTPDAYRETVRKKLLDENKEANVTSLKKAIWKYIFTNATVTGYPENVLEDQIKALEDYYEHTVAAKDNLHLKEYVKNEGYESVTQFRDEVLKPQAESDIKKNLVLYAFAKQVGVTVSEADAKASAKKDYDENVKPMLSFYSQYLGVTDLNSYIQYIGGIESVRVGKLYDDALMKVIEGIPGAILGED